MAQHKSTELEFKPFMYANVYSVKTIIIMD